MANMASMPRHVRILREDEPSSDGPQAFELESGDELLVTATSDSVLLSLDDCGETKVPTARLTPQEAARLGSALLRAAQRAGR